MTAVDWILLAVLGLSFVLGLWRGLTQEVLSLAGWVAGFYISQWYAPKAADWLPMQGSSEMLRYGAGFVVVFMAVLVVTTVLTWLLRQVVSAVGLGLFDRVLGGVFGLLRAGVLLLAVTVVVAMTPLHDSEAWQQARVARWFESFLHVLKPLLPADFGKYLP